MSRGRQFSQHNESGEPNIPLVDGIHIRATYGLGFAELPSH